MTTPSSASRSTDPVRSGSHSTVAPGPTIDVVNLVNSIGSAVGSAPPSLAWS